MLITPASSMFRVNAAATEAVYSCPNTRTHAFVSLAIHAPASNPAAANYSIAIKSDATAPASTDRFVNNVPLNPGTNALFNSLVLGPNHTLFVSATNHPVNVRLTAVEENNPAVTGSGLLANVSCPANTATQIFIADTPDLVVVSYSLIVRNTGASQGSATIHTDTATPPGIASSFLRENIPAGQTIIFDNLLAMPGERVFVNAGSEALRAFAIGVRQVETP
jgi:hypothetical protein